MCSKNEPTLPSLPCECHRVNYKPINEREFHLVISIDIDRGESIKPFSLSRFCQWLKRKKPTNGFLTLSESYDDGDYKYRKYYGILSYQLTLALFDRLEICNGPHQTLGVIGFPFSGPAVSYRGELTNYHATYIGSSNIYLTPLPDNDDEGNDEWMFDRLCEDFDEVWEEDDRDGSVPNYVFR